MLNLSYFPSFPPGSSARMCREKWWMQVSWVSPTLDRFQPFYPSGRWGGARAPLPNPDWTNTQQRHLGNASSFPLSHLSSASPAPAGGRACGWGGFWFPCRCAGALPCLDEHMLAQQQLHRSHCPPAALQGHAPGWGFQKPSTPPARSCSKELAPVMDAGYYQQL